MKQERIGTGAVEKLEGAATIAQLGISSLAGNTKRHPKPNWPDLADLGLSRAQLASRSRCIGGSDANIIFSGQEQLILQLWKEKRGVSPSEDLSARLPVMLGCWTEAFNRQWYEKCTGDRIDAVGATMCCSIHSWRQCTLDGFVEAKTAVWEAKHTNGFGKPEDLLGRYMPQLQHNMAVAGAPRALLSVIFGNHKWEVFEVASDWLYQEDLLEAEKRFWHCVETGETPVASAVPPPPKPVSVREICFEGNNAWAVAAADWLENREAARKHAAAGASIKSLVEDDVARAFGHGIEAKRSKAGALTIKELRP
jgi:predicted phage-related endonuclease